MKIQMHLFLNLVPRLILVAVWAAGILVAALRWRRHPRVSLLAILGVGMLAFFTILGWVFSLLLPHLYHLLAALRLSEGYAVFIYSILGTLINAVAMSLILAAIFTGRDPAAKLPAAKPPTESFPPPHANP
jgi:hypothetical protein